MTSAASIARPTAFAAIAAGACVTAGFAFSLMLTPGKAGEEANGAPFLLSNGFSLAGAFLLALAVAGLYAWHRDRAGGLGLAGFAGAMFGCVMAGGGYWGLLFVFPYVAGQSPEALNGPAAGTLLAGLMVSTLGFGAGWLVFAASALRAGVLPRAPLFLIVAGSATSVVVALFPIPRFCLLFTAWGVAWLGITMKRRSARAENPENPPKGVDVLPPRDIDAAPRKRHSSGTLSEV